MGIPEIILAIIAIVVGAVIGYFVHKSIVERNLDAAHETAQGILADAKKQAETDTKEARSQRGRSRYRSDVEKDLKRRQKSKARRPGRSEKNMIARVTL